MGCLSFVQQRKGTVAFGTLIYVIICYTAYNKYWSLSGTIKRTISVHYSYTGFGSTNQSQNQASKYGDYHDIHLEDEFYGHTGETSGSDTHHQPKSSSDPHRFDPDPKTVAIGLGITSKNVQGASVNNIAQKFQLFFTFLPSFCKTATLGYKYSFYLAYDHTDPLFSTKHFLEAFSLAFADTTKRLCDPEVQTSLHLVQCSHAGMPAWAQNDAMLEAYLDNIAYFYRVNDDTQLLAAGWTEKFVAVLAGYNPPNIGVVGPNHSGGNTAILTYDFVSQHHLRAFGFYYPRLFTDWWGDDWVTYVYKPNRMTKLMDMKLAHTLGAGQRYNVHDWKVAEKLKRQLEVDKITLQRYVKYVQDLTSNPQKYKTDGKKVIAVALFGRDPKLTWGAIRQAQTIAWFFPGWTYRVYVPADSKGRPLSRIMPPSKSKQSQEKENDSPSLLSQVKNLLFGSGTENKENTAPTNAGVVNNNNSNNDNNNNNISSVGGSVVGINMTFNSSVGSNSLLNSTYLVNQTSEIKVSSNTTQSNPTQSNNNSGGTSNEINTDEDYVEQAIRGSIAVPLRIRHKLQQLGAEIVGVPYNAGVPVRLMHYAIMDDPNVETFLIRSTDTRFSDREEAAIAAWLKLSATNTENSPLVHCMRDHKAHSTNRVVEGLWGANAAFVRKSLQGKSIFNLISQFFPVKSSAQRLEILNLNSSDTTSFLHSILWPLLGGRALCHDGYCGKEVRPPGYQDFPSTRSGQEYVGRKFDDHQIPLEETVPTGKECNTNSISDVEKGVSEKFLSTISRNVPTASKGFNIDGKNIPSSGVSGRR